MALSCLVVQLPTVHHQCFYLCVSENLLNFFIFHVNRCLSVKNHGKFRLSHDKWSVSAFFASREPFDTINVVNDHSNV